MEAKYIKEINFLITFQNQKVQKSLIDVKNAKDCFFGY